MKQIQFLFLPIFLTTQFLSAQITYTIDDYAAVGETFEVVHVYDAITDDFTVTGADYNWDYSGLTQNAPETYGYEDPNNSAFKNIWCLYHFYITNCNTKFNENFNMGMSLAQSIDLGGFTLSDPYQHLMKANNKLQLKMYGANADLDGSTLPSILEYGDPDDLLRFPMTYNSSYSDDNSIDMDFTILGVNLIVQAEGTRTNIVEGWGSLKIPNHTFSNVLKVKSVLNQTFNVEYQGEEMEIPVNVMTYYWFDVEYGIPVLMVQGTGGEGTFMPMLATYPYFVPDMGINELELTKHTVFPNPTTGMINLNLQINETLKSVQIFDQSGKRIGQSLDLSKLPKGVYILKAVTSQRTITEKVIKK